MARPLRLLHDSVMVLVHEGERVRPSGIILPERPYDFNKKNEAGTRATVVEVSPWPFHEVVKGDEVLIEKFGGIELTLNGQEVVILNSDEIIAIIESDDWSGARKAILNG